jgi:DNA-binding SARP family transcriptional activator/predicted ATPase
MADLKLFFLGSPRIERDGVPLSFDTRKAIALLAYLAVSGPSATREALATLLFPEYEADRAYANLRRTLWTLNKAGLDPWLDVSTQQIGLKRGTGLWIDIEEFRRLVAGIGSPSAAAVSVNDLEAAASLYRGDFLAGLSLKDSPEFDEWQFFQTESLRQELASVLERLSRELASQAAFDAAIGHARRWLSLDPLREPAHRWLMRLYALAGHRAAALRQYQECAELLRKELAAEPEAETQALYAEISKGPQPRRVWGARPPPIPAAPSGTPPSPPHNLPVPSTPFVGRHRELEQIQALLVAEPRSGTDSTCRLLTLLGPGGIGKTRLAVRAAGEALPAFPDGVCFVPLDSVRSPDVLPAAVLQALRTSGVLRQDSQAAAGDQKQILFRHLREKRALLVADNFEHLLAAAGTLAEVLAQAPGVKILVTSRERLGLQEEWVMDIAGLDYPEARGQKTTADLQNYSAVVLFQQGALRARPDFQLTSTDAPHIARICQLVEGMPLGIELAAAWLRVLPCQDIAVEIESSLDLLSGSVSNVPERHRSLRAVFDSSWQMLSAEEQAAFKRLSLCHGGFDRITAGQIANADLATLSGLLNKSWLWRRRDGRFEIHELLRQYGGEKLDEQPRDGAAARDQHSRYYLGWFSRLKADLKGNRQQGALREIRQDTENVRAAWEWAVERLDWEPIGAAAESLWIFCFYVSAFAEGERMFRRAAERSTCASQEGSATAGALLGCLLARQGAFHLLTAQYAPARELLERGLALLRLAGDPAETAFALNQLGNLAYASGDLPVASSRYAESLAIRRGLPDRWNTASSLYNLGSLLGYFGEYEQARRLCDESLAIRRDLNDRVGLAFVLGDLGSIALYQGDLAEARRFFDEALTIRRELTDDIVVPHSYSRGDLSDVAFQEGNYVEAEKLISDSLANLRKVGNVWNIPFALGRLALVRCVQGNYPEARKLLEEGLSLVGERAEPLATAHLLNQLGAVWACAGEYAEAERCHERSLALARERSHRPEIAAALAGLGRAACAQGAYERGRSLCTEALGMFTAMGARLEVAALSQTLDDIARALGTADDRAYPQA